MRGHHRRRPGAVARGEGGQKLAVMIHAAAQSCRVVTAEGAPGHRDVDEARQRRGKPRIAGGGDDQLVETVIVEGDPVEPIRIRGARRGIHARLQPGELGTLLRREADGRALGRMGFEQFTQREDVVEIGAAPGVDEGALIGDEIDETLGVQAAQHLAHRRAADPQSIGQGRLGQVIAGGELPRDDGATDGLVDAVGCGRHIGLGASLATGQAMIQCPTLYAMISSGDF